MSRKTKVNIFKFVMLAIIIGIIIGAIIYLWPLFKNISTSEGQIAFKQKIQDLGFIGMLMLFGLQFAQIFLIIIPGEPVEVLAGMCYGTFGGTLFITISACIITTIIFFAVRVLGRKFVYSFCKEESVKKIENSKLFQNPKKIEWIMLILFLIPGTPKDLLVYIAGLLPIKPIRFILISTFGRFPSVISSTIAGENILLGNLQISIIAYIVTFIVVGIAIFIINKLDKSKTTEEAINFFKKEKTNEKV